MQCAISLLAVLLIILKRHAEIRYHKERTKQKKSNIHVPQFVEDQKTLNRNRQVKEREINLVAFAVEHNISINVVAYLPKVIQSISPNSAFTKKANMWKKHSLIANVLGIACKEE